MCVCLCVQFDEKTSIITFAIVRIGPKHHHCGLIYNVLNFHFYYIITKNGYFNLSGGSKMVCAPKCNERKNGTERKQRQTSFGVGFVCNVQQAAHTKAERH